MVHERRTVLHLLLLPLRAVHVGPSGVVNFHSPPTLLLTPPTASYAPGRPFRAVWSVESRSLVPPSSHYLPSSTHALGRPCRAVWCENLSFPEFAPRSRCPIWAMGGRKRKGGTRCHWLPVRRLYLVDLARNCASLRDRQSVKLRGEGAYVRRP